MVVVLQAHDLSIFNQVPQLHDAIRNFENVEARKQIKKLYHIFSKHKVAREYGLMLVHRHFDLKNGEMLVESVDKKRASSVALPWAVTEDSKATPVDEKFYKSFDLRDDPFIVPQSWIFVESGDVKAFEFLTSEEKLRPPPAEFVTELYNELKVLNLHRILGLRRVHHLLETSTWETTPDNARANITTYGNNVPDGINKEDMITVVWRVSETANNFNENDFCGICFCNNHQHCSNH